MRYTLRLTGRPIRQYLSADIPRPKKSAFVLPLELMLLLFIFLIVGMAVEG